MAVVLPIHSQLDFSNPMDNDESSSAMFTNRESENESNDQEISQSPDENQEHDAGKVDESDDSWVDLGNSSDDCNEPPETLPLNETDAVADSTTNDDAIPSAEEETPENVSVDNYWSMNEDESGEPVSNLVEAIVTDRENDNNEDGMEIDGASTPLTTTINECNEDDAENVDVDYSPIPTMEEASVEEDSLDSPPYGGLSNLGNTCYMASAIQLLCGLDSFPADLKSRLPPPNNNNSEDDNEQALRDALLDVMDRLGNGQTVSPNDLKRCIDSRTSLFLGYRQQDSHEFLTTLLDIIDEDYKLKPKREEPMVTTTESHDDADEHEVTDDEDNEEQEETQTIAEECNDEDETDCESNDDRMILESAQKKQKVVDDEPLIEVSDEEQSLAAEAIETGEDVAETASIAKSKSYSDFQFSDIENLLHAKSENPAGESSTSQTEASVPTKIIARQDEPKCKLAGGRMSTAGVELTRFAEEGGLDDDVQPTGVSLETATPQQQIVENDEAEEEESTEETFCSPVSSNFTTKVRVCLTCESCKFRRSKIETYLHLSLDISTGSNETNNDDDDSDDEGCNLGCPSSSSIEEGLRRFFAPEKREIKCEKCFHTSALQTSEITQLPRNLLFHLKRFIVDVSPDYSSISYRKDQSSVVFAERMELQASDDEDETDVFHNVHEDQERGIQAFLAQDSVYEPDAAYEIRSVVNHIGSSASCGHYTADAKRKMIGSIETDENEDTSDDDETAQEPMVEDREWIRFNDCYVSRISSKEAVQDASKTAYMIMYELV